MKRVASVIGLKAENREEYERYHAAVWPAVLARLTASNIHNYSIYRHGELLFSYFEYTGEDYDADMASVAADPETQRWWALMEPMQEKWSTAAPDEWWSTMTEVFHTE